MPAPLPPGEHSIDTATPYQRKGRAGVTITWRIRTHDGRVLTRITQGTNVGDARKKAKALAKELLRTPGTGSWTVRSSFADWMEAVVEPLLSSDRLSDETTRRYDLAYRLVLDRCGVAGCRHRHSLAGLTIHDAMLPDNLASCIEEIGRLHGKSNAKPALTVLSRYAASRLKRSRLIEYNPLRDLDLDLSDARPVPKEKRRGGKALTLDQYRAVIAYLLALDVTDVVPPKRGRWTVEHRVAQRTLGRDLVLAQAATGLRTSELALRTVRETKVERDGTVVFLLDPDAAKGGYDRPAPCLLPEVSELLRARRKAAAGPDAPLFGAPADPSKTWQPRSRDRVLEDLYKELGRELDIPMFAVERGHSWRTTLNSVLFHAMPEATRIRLLGHTQQVNRRHYTAVTSTAEVVEQASLLRAPDVSPDGSSDGAGSEGNDG